MIFYPGLPLTEKLENFMMEKDPKPAAVKQPYEQDYNPAATNNQSGRTVWIVFAILIGLTAIIWGGYTLYNNNTDDEGDQAVVPATPEQVTPLPDTTQAKVADTTTVVANTSRQVVEAVSSSGSQTYKFIIRTASKNYVMNRYNDLKASTPTLNWDTKDSIVYRLFLTLPATPGDTARIRDSLQSWYGAKKVIIEN